MLLTLCIEKFRLQLGRILGETLASSIKKNKPIVIFPKPCKISSLPFTRRKLGTRTAPHC